MRLAKPTYSTQFNRLQGPSTQVSSQRTFLSDNEHRNKSTAQNSDIPVKGPVTLFYEGRTVNAVVNKVNESIRKVQFQIDGGESKKFLSFDEFRKARRRAGSAPSRVRACSSEAEGRPPANPRHDTYSGRIVLTSPRYIPHDTHGRIYSRLFGWLSSYPDIV